MTQNQNQQPKKIFNRLMTSIVVLVVLLILALAAAGYFYYQTKTMVKNNQSQQPTDSEAEFNQIIEAVGKLLILPENERPTLATVTDPKVLKGQPFFANAEVGDKVLVYSISGRVILYRPSVNKVISVAPLSFNSHPDADATAPQN